MNPFDIINIPLGYLIKIMYTITGNYAVALLFFAIVVKLALLPLNIKQQKGQVKMSAMRPKENAIRKKYAGRSDTATQQKMQAEIMDLYKAEGHSPMAGCLPMLIQLPIILALYNIVRNPLTYIASFGKENLQALKDKAFELFNNSNLFTQFADMFKGITETTTKNIPDVNLIKIMSDAPSFDSLRASLPFLENYKHINLNIFGNVNIADAPVQALNMFQAQNKAGEPLQYALLLLLLIPILNFAVNMIQTKLTSKLNSGTPMDMNTGAMKMMQWTLPLMTVYMTFTLSSALGLYWLYQGIIQIVQTILLYKYFPIPKISEAEIKAAEEQYGVVKKKKKKKYDEDGNLIESAETAEAAALAGDGEKPVIDTTASDAAEPDGDGEKYVSEKLPKGINPNIKNNYSKTGKKYNIKRK